MGVAADLGMAVSAGAEAEQIALREARRVQAGIPADWNQPRVPDIFDTALEAVAPLGGLTLAGSEPRQPPRSPLEEPNAVSRVPDPAPAVRAGLRILVRPGQPSPNASKRWNQRADTLTALLMEAWTREQEHAHAAMPSATTDLPSATPLTPPSIEPLLVKSVVADPAA